MSGSTRYFRVSYTLSPTFALHILPQHFAMVSPLERQLNIQFENRKIANNLKLMSKLMSKLMIIFQICPGFH
jgi:hypothetical protein